MDRTGGSIQAILASGLGHKEQVTRMVELVQADDGALSELFEILRTGREADRGTAAEVMKFVSKERPERMLPYIDVLIEYIDYKAPRVRWGCPEALGNLAAHYPEQVGQAIPKLLGNLEDKSTVVRWCAAYALAEIAKANLDKQAELVERFEGLILTEPNSGVRNVYLKALKQIEKQRIPRSAAGGGGNNG